MSEAGTLGLTFEDGARAVELARDSVAGYVLHGQREQPGSMRDAFYARTGAFVRLQSTRGRGSLRGCAGTYRSSEQLGHEIVDAAIQAASSGSCGSEVEPAELSNLTVSVCVVGDVVLSNDPLADLELGRHGLVVPGDGTEGFLYPTIPIENGWTREEYLERACRKAGLPPGAWATDDVTVTIFESQIFREREPEGAVEQL